MNTTTDTAAKITIVRDGTTFVIDSALRIWAFEELGESFWFSGLEELTERLYQSLGVVRTIELYGVPNTHRLYVKVTAPGTPRQQTWFLDFRERDGRQFFRING